MPFQFVSEMSDGSARPYETVPSALPFSPRSSSSRSRKLRGTKKGMFFSFTCEGRKKYEMRARTEECGVLEKNACVCFVRDFVVSERCASRPVIGTKGRNSFVVEEGTAYLWPPLSPPSLTTPPREGNEAVLRWRWVWDSRWLVGWFVEGRGRGRSVGERERERIKGQPNGQGKAGKNTLVVQCAFLSNHGGYSLEAQSFFEHSGLGFLPQGSGWFSKASFGGVLPSPSPFAYLLRSQDHPPLPLHSSSASSSSPKSGVENT